jgi:hypothetical protein
MLRLSVVIKWYTITTRNISIIAKPILPNQHMTTTFYITCIINRVSRV